MEQKIPNVTEADVKRIVQRDFRSADFAIVQGLLQQYLSENQKGRNRVHASILKLSNGNLELVRQFVERANKDFRDVIALAEYPTYSQYAFDENLSDSNKRQLIESDWKQYINWLNEP